MKCTKCNKQWEIFGKNKEQLAKCPFCNNKITANFKNFSNVSESIYYAITVGSKKNSDILANKSKLWGFLSDAIDSSSPESNIVKLAVNSNVGKLLYDVMNGSDADKQSAVDSAVSQLNREYGMDRTKAYEVVGYFTKAMGWNLTVSAPEPVAVPAPAPKPQVQQKALQAAPGNAAMNVVPASNAEIIQPQSNTAPVQKKKSKAGFIVAMIAVLLAAGAVAVLLNKQKLPVLAPEKTTSATTTETTADTAETTTAVPETEHVETTADTSKVTTTAAEETTTAETVTTVGQVTEDEDKTADTEESTTEETSGAVNDSPDAARSVRNIVSNVGDVYLKSSDSKMPFELQKFCISPTEKVMYYIEGTKLFSCDIDGGSPVEKFDFSKLLEQNNLKMQGATLRYNPYDEKTYIFFHYEAVGVLLDVNSDLNSDSFKVIDLSDIYAHHDLYSLYFTDKNIAEIYYEEDYSSYCLKVSEYNIENGNRIDGNVFLPLTSDGPYYRRIYSAVPFLYNDDYYWLERSFDDKYRAYIVYTRNTVRNSKKDCGISLGYINDCLSSCVYNNEIYIMTSDFSVYKFNMEVLMSRLESENETEKDKLSFSSQKEKNKPARELVVNGSKIKQTGRNNLNTITCFDVVGDGRFVVFDDFDKTYKIIETQ